MDAVLVYCSCPDDAVAAEIAQAVVAERLAACVSRMSGMVSTYRWEGEIQHDGEVLLLIKSTRQRFDALRLRLLEMHPYELPEIIAVDIGLGHPPYLEWLCKESAAP